LTVLAIATILGGCVNKETGETPGVPLFFITQYLSAQVAVQSTVQTIPTGSSLEPLFDAGLDLKASPVAVPLQIEIPTLKINAPVLGVGLTMGNEMDAPRGEIDDPIWDTVYWYRGSGKPGESGTATVAGHVNDPLGRPEIFANLHTLKPGDWIIIRYTLQNVEFAFNVDKVENYSLQESSDPAVLTKIFGSGPVNGKAPQPSPDGLSHLTLITCAGTIVDGQFDHHVVVFATRHQENSSH
jgi:hypothetical protein